MLFDRIKGNFTNRSVSVTYRTVCFVEGLGANIKENAMKTKRLVLVLAMAMVGVIFLAGGCKKTEPGGGGGIAKAQAAVALCLKCGQIKGSDVCCKEGAVTCDKCGLAKDSPGCCKIAKDAESAAICTKCGQIKGSDVCCKEGAATCDKCGLAKGSPGCCILPKL